LQAIIRDQIAEKREELELLGASDLPLLLPSPPRSETALGVPTSPQSCCFSSPSGNKTLYGLELEEEEEEDLPMATAASGGSGELC
jgi:hypothetical protein